jgi:hypothetical protein
LRNIQQILFLACALPMVAQPRIKVIKLAVTNPGEQTLTSAVVPIRDLVRVAPDLKGTFIVTTSDAATVEILPR